MRESAVIRSNMLRRGFIMLQLKGEWFKQIWKQWRWKNQNKTEDKWLSQYRHYLKKKREKKRRECERLDENKKRKGKEQEKAN